MVHLRRSRHFSDCRDAWIAAFGVRLLSLLVARMGVVAQVKIKRMCFDQSRCLNVVMQRMS